MSEPVMVRGSDEARYPRALTPASWPTAVGIHIGRLIRRWLRSPTILIVAVAMPAVSMLAIVVMFRGMIEQFAGGEMDLTGVTVMVAVTSMLTGALMGAGSTVQERREGLMSRIDTFPGPRSAAFAGRILAESLRAFLSSLLAMIVGALLGADYGSLPGAARILAVLALVALASGVFGVMMGYLAETPQGAVTAAPLVMTAMFFNTAMMPRELYAEVLRPVVDISPITAVAQLGHDARAGVLDSGHLWLCTLWFGGLALLGLIVIVRKTRRRDS